MDIRTAQNYSWSCEGGNDARENIMCRDVFARDMQREMGEPYTRSRYVHILLNGHYWGLYQFQERAEEHFAETTKDKFYSGLISVFRDEMNLETFLAGGGND